MTNDKAAVLIKKTALFIEKLSNHVLAPYELTNTQYRILMMLYRNKNKPVRQADIEAHLAMTNPTVTGIIQNLERKGLIKRVQNPDDKRSKLLVLTQQAVSSEMELRELGEELEKQVTEKLTEDECQQLVGLLKKILEE